MSLLRHKVLLWGLILFSLTATTAVASIRVVEDEVYFTLKAPGAERVYLVGDFNNWNATVEKMTRSGDVFEISLYLVEGTYRYKFVVDGNWIADPDNPGDDPARGSLIVLVEKPAGLVLREEDPDAPVVAPSVTPTFRYFGQSRWNSPDESGFRDDHYLDFGLDIDREKLRGNVVIRTYDDSWSDTDWTAEITLDGAFVGTDVAGLGLDAFDNHDVVWNSSDPFALVGDVGVYNYGAGYARKGAAARYRFLGAVQLNAVYADHTNQIRGVWPPLPPTNVYDSSKQAGDITYTWEPGAADSDLFGFEIFADSRDFQLGIVTRSNRGLNQGTLSKFEPSDSTADQFETVENNETSVYWVRLKKLFGLGAVVGYGRGASEIQRLSYSRWQVLPSGSSVPLGPATEINVRNGFETSDRYLAGLDLGYGAAFSIASVWDRSVFRFEGAAHDNSEATIDRVSLWSAYTPSMWRFSLDARYTSQDYGDTPATLLIDSPARNMWLDWRDKFDVPDIVGIDTDAYTDVTIAARWIPRAAAETVEEGTTPVTQQAWIAARQGDREIHPADPAPGVRLELGATTRGFLESSEYSFARLQAAWLFRDRWYTQVDGRYSVYDKPGWGEEQSFVCGYVEAGYLYKWLDVNIGWGLDPVVFDSNLSEFHDIGRLEVLRRSIADGVRRSDSAVIGDSLLSLERQLRDAQTIKLELIFRF